MLVHAGFKHIFEIYVAFTFNVDSIYCAALSIGLFNNIPTLLLGLEQIPRTTLSKYPGKVRLLTERVSDSSKILHLMKILDMPLFSHKPLITVPYLWWDKEASLQLQVEAPSWVTQHRVRIYHRMTSSSQHQDSLYICSLPVCMRRKSEWLDYQLTGCWGLYACLFCYQAKKNTKTDLLWVYINIPIGDQFPVVSMNWVYL